MKINPNLTLRNIAGEYLIVNPISCDDSISNVFELSESAAFLWENLKNFSSFNIQNMYEILSKEYEIINYNETLKDLEELASEWLKIGIAQE